jgi:urease accessory protein
MKAPATIPRRVWSVAVGALGCTLLPSPAEAHLVTTGLGPVYDGILHVLASPDDMVPIVALALLAGLNGPTAGRWSLFTLTGAWLAGGVAGFLAGSTSIPGAATTASFLVLGVLAAIDRRLSPAVVMALAMAVGLLHGWLNGAALAQSQREAIGIVGIVGMTFVLVALISAFVVSVRAVWARMAMRVAGSWVAAIGLLMLGWSLRGGL